jgi:hypothetical protein
VVVIEEESKIEKLKVDGVNYGYQSRKKLNSGQTVAIFFVKEERSRSTDYHILLLIANKKRDINDFILEKRDVLTDKITGRCGLEGLFWAKRMLLKFEDMIAQKYCGEKEVCIVINATDSRRKKVYIQSLKKYGYILSIRDNKQSIFKKLCFNPNIIKR